ncbi:hypothetical protein MSG28_006980 [Choristoneura fumiferana]|uniref:Uncharacterized protein n=1 Tax=Choristoneura fumiferana TaxID=7141 RepID=A0ACC0JLZ2_CHOFU|nr:hypothetical protein MSG28_006980 [Choristoneura fumiferana]
MLARSHLSSAGMRARIKITEDCQIQDQPRAYDSLFWAFFAFMAILTAAALLGTYLNSRRDKTEPKTWKDDIAEAFCLKANAKDLLSMKKEGIEVLYGIRFLTISFIVLDHQLGIFNSGAISDGLQVDQDIMSIMGLFVLHDDLFVDTFFFLSGFLSATSFNKFKNFPNPLLFMLKRYVRLVVAFAVMVFFVCAVYPYTGSGPLWPRGIAADTDQCRKNWWLSLLMLNNYIDSENICIVVSWYIPADFHCFCVSVLLYWLYKRCPRLAGASAVVITIIAIILPGVINYVYDMPAVQLFTYDEHFHLTYIKSHTRAGAFIVGFMSGLIFIKTYRENSPKISKKWSILGSITALVIMLVVMVMGTTFIWRSYHRLEGAIYAALNRPIWTCGVAMLVLCCALGHVPLVKSFLCWYPWVPLSRLSYGLYLTHSLLISRNVFTTRNSQDNDYPELLIAAVGVIVFGCLAALVIWLLAEAPANNLLALLLRPSSRTTKEASEEKLPDTRNTSIDSLPSSSRGHLRDNLPTNITFSSKM